MKIVGSRRHNAEVIVPVNGAFKVKFVNGRATVPNDVALALDGIGGGFYWIVGDNLDNVLNGGSVLVIRDASIGDVLMTTPFVRELSKKGAYVDVLTRDAFKCLYDGNPYVRNVFGMETDHPNHDDYNAVIDLCRFVENQDVAGRRMHRVDGFASYADLPLSSRKLDYFVTDEEKAWARQAMLGIRTEKSPVVGYVWRASRSERSLSTKRHLAVLDGLVAAGLSVIVIDRDYISDVPISPKIWNATGHTSLREAAAILGGCDVVVSPDTGLFHIASALDKPVVGLFSTMPIEERATHTKLKMVDSRENCSRFPCRQYHCLNRDGDNMPRCLDVRVEDVVGAVRDVTCFGTYPRR